MSDRGPSNFTRPGGGIIAEVLIPGISEGRDTCYLMVVQPETMDVVLVPFDEPGKAHSIVVTVLIEGQHTALCLGIVRDQPGRCVVYETNGSVPSRWLSATEGRTAVAALLDDDPDIYQLICDVLTVRAAKEWPEWTAWRGQVESETGREFGYLVDGDCAQGDES